MTRIGDQTSPDLAQYRIGNVEQQVATRLTMPERGIVSEVGAWVRGVTGYGAVDYRVCLWRWNGAVSNTNALLGQSAIHSASAAGVAPGNLVKVTWPLVTPVELEAGDTFMVGIATDTSPGNAAQWGLHTGGTHYLKDRSSGAAWPTNMSGCYTDGGTGAFWVENYDATGAAWIRRSGAWVRADAVYTRRSGAWVQADTVAVRRGGAWVDAD